MPSLSHHTWKSYLSFNFDKHGLYKIWPRKPYIFALLNLSTLLLKLSMLLPKFGLTSKSRWSNWDPGLSFIQVCVFIYDTLMTGMKILARERLGSKDFKESWTANILQVSKKENLIYTKWTNFLHNFYAFWDIFFLHS